MVIDLFLRSTKFVSGCAFSEYVVKGHQGNYSFESFSRQHLPMVSLWSLSDRKSPQVSRTLFSILADLNNAVIWMVSTRPLISKSPSPCIKPLVIVSRTPITIGITVTFKFHSFLFLLQGPGIYLSFCFLSILLCCQPGLLCP